MSWLTRLFSSQPRPSDDAAPRQSETIYARPDGIETINEDLVQWRARLQALPVSALPTFPRRMKSETPWWLNSYEMPPADLRKMFARVNDAYTLAVLASLHPSGYFMKAAIARLNGVLPYDESLK